MWILELLKNQSDSWKSPGNLCLKKGTNPVLNECKLHVQNKARFLYLLGVHSILQEFLSEDKILQF